MGVASFTGLAENQTYTITVTHPDYTSGQKITFLACGQTGSERILVSPTATPPPGITIGAPSASSTQSGPVTYLVTYSDATSVTLDPSDITLNKTGTANGVLGVSGSGTANRTVTISAISGEGTLGISIAAGTATGTGGVAPTAGPSATFAVDNINVTGSLLGRILPGAARKAGAQWRVELAPGVWSEWKNHNEVVTGLEAGEHTVEFDALFGWDGPTSKTVTIVANQQRKKSGIYCEYGAVLVKLKPAEARKTGARWRVSKGPSRWSKWKKNMQMVRGLTEGAHVVECNEVAGWIKPGNKYININLTTGTIVARPYKSPIKTLVKGLQPAAERKAGSLVFQDRMINEKVLRNSSGKAWQSLGTPQSFGVPRSAIAPSSVWSMLEAKGFRCDAGGCRATESGGDVDGWVARPGLWNIHRSW
jgi:hypothetical protein